MAPSRCERGFALPLTLFVVAMVTIVLSAALIQTEVDRRIAESSADEVDVVSLAQTGLQQYLGTTTFDGCERARRPVDGDSVRINLTGGYAEVVARVVQKPVPDTLAPWTYVVRSTAQIIKPALGAEPQAARTVAQFAQWNSGWMDPLAAFVAANGLIRSPSGTCEAAPNNPNPPQCGEFRGADQAPSCGAAVPFLRVAGALPFLADSGYTVDGLGPVAGYSKAALAAATNIDWATTIGGGVVPDYTYVKLYDTSYPVMLVNGNATLGTFGGDVTGYGLLIVTGDLRTLGNKVQWYGVVLVGGKIDFDAYDQRFDGMVVSGLKAQLGMPVPSGSIGGDYTDIDYDSYYMRLALKSLAGFGPVANAAILNWATY